MFPSHNLSSHFPVNPQLNQNQLSYSNNPSLLNNQPSVNVNPTILPKLMTPFPFTPHDPFKYKDIPLKKKTMKLKQLANDEKLLKVLKEQTDLMEKLLLKYKKKDDERMGIYDQRVEKFTQKSEKVKVAKIKYNVIQEKIDQSNFLFSCSEKLFIFF